MISNSEKWKAVLTSGMKSGNEVKRGNGPLHCASAKEVDTVKYLSEYWDLKGFTRETVLSARSKT
jgi:hypothetical protein